MAKTFKDKIQQKATNPALLFISQPEPEQPQQAEEKPKKKTSAPSSAPKKQPQARRALPQYDEETKSRRLQLLLTPSLYKDLKRQAASERTSVNELVNSILKDYLRK